jgi:hypothetical protein
MEEGCNKTVARAPGSLYCRLCLKAKPEDAEEEPEAEEGPEAPQPSLLDKFVSDVLQIWQQLETEPEAKPTPQPKRTRR